MDEHTKGLRRKWTDAELEKWTVTELMDLAGDCDVEPADPTICDACAAYLIAQNKEKPYQPSESELADARAWREENFPGIADPGHRAGDITAHQAVVHRPWLFEPGDRVLCLMPTQKGDELVAGSVVRIQIPGPIHPEKVVYVQLEDERLPIKLGWWDPVRVERLGG